jgi:hypothetical protein
MATKIKKTITTEAAAAGMKVCQQVAKRYKGISEDVLGACYEAMLIAWNSYDPSRGVPFAAYCNPYVREYARREATRLQSVVVTNAARLRKLDRAESLTVMDEEAGFEVQADLCDNRLLQDDVVAARESLRDTYESFAEAINELPMGARDLARDLVESRLIGHNEESLQTVADRHNVSRQYAHKVEKALLAAAE